MVGVGATALILLAYWGHDGFRGEVQRALTVVVAGDPTAVGAYLRGFGLWGPVASLGLMILQAVDAPAPAVLIAFANGLAFGVVVGGILTVVGQSLAVRSASALPAPSAAVQWRRWPGGWGSGPPTVGSFAGASAPSSSPA